jgi:phage tail sheath protein FI
MPEYLAPGVFVEEVSYRAKSIEGVSTTTTGFVGATRYGPIDIEPDIITSLVEFERVYGGRQPLEFTNGGTPTDNYMWNAVRAFFEEGGKRLYVARAFQSANVDNVTKDPRYDLACAKATGTTPPANVTISARFPGKAGQARVRLQFWASQNRIAFRGGKAVLTASADGDVVFVNKVTIGSDKKGLYILRRDAQKDLWTFDDGSGTTFEVQQIVGQADAVVRTVTATVYVEPQAPGLPFFAATSLALDRSHRSGGAPDSIFDYFAAKPVNLAASRTIPIVIRELTKEEATEEKKTADAIHTAAKKADDDQQVVVNTKKAAELQAKTDSEATPADLTLKKKWDDAIAARIAAEDAKKVTAAALVRALEVQKAAQDVLNAANSGVPRTGLSFAKDYLVADPAGTDPDPANRFSYKWLAANTGSAPFLDAVFFLTGGDDGKVPEQEAYEGVEDAANRKSGLKALEDIEDISIVAAPGSTASAASAQAVANVLIGHAERMQYRIAVLDSIKGQSIAEVRAYRGKFDSSHAAFYYPWVRIVDPNTGQENVYPPSGFVAGIYARNDIERAVYKAPANEIVTLALGFEKLLNKAQQEVLNPEGINCFRFFEGRGMRLWGARTASSDPEWKYVNLRRYFAYLERSIDKGTQWAVFEPNGERLWANVRRTISDFLLNEWQSGALLGDKPEKAYFVKCDRSTMTQNDLDNGRLICQVGVAPLRPAEFVIFRIGQWTADSKA